jgi:transcription elongation factor GreB
MSKAFLRESDFPESPPLAPPVSTLPPGAKNYLTPEGADRLREELSRLTGEARPALATLAASDVDAKRDLQTLDQRIRHLRESLRTAEIVPSREVFDDVVRFGSTVTVRDHRGEEARYRLVGVDETDVERGYISWTSPLARALTNARLGEVVNFSVPAGRRELTIVAIE